MTEPLSAVCTKCGADKPLDEFCDDPKKKNGKKSQCRNCDNQRSRAAYARNKQLPEPVFDSLQCKTCALCGESKLLNEFHKSTVGSFRRHPQCKKCRSETRQQHRKDWKAEIRVQPEGVKTCTKCDETKDLSEFSDDPEGKLGKRSYCISCGHVIANNWKANHPEEVQAYAKDYYDAHADEIKQQHRDTYHGLSPEEKQALHASRREYQSDYQRKNRNPIRIQKIGYRRKKPELFTTLRQRRRARVNEAPVNDLSPEQWLEIQAHYQYRCVYCPDNCVACKKKTHKLTPDHVTPYAANGSNTLWNVVPACFSHNASKGARPPLKPVQMMLLTIAKAKDNKKKTS